MTEQRSHTDVLRDSRSRRISFWKRTGTTRVLPLDASDADYIAHLKARCTVTESGCWECAGFQYKSKGMKRASKGYVDFTYRRRRIRAHRISYILHFGPIPDGMEVCHRCDNPPCCNPDHLFLGTGSQNALDRVAKKRDRNRSRTHCIRGHELAGDNLRITPTLRGFRRQCITCEKTVHHKSERYKAWRRQWQNRRRAEKRALRTDEDVSEKTT